MPKYKVLAEQWDRRLSSAAEAPVFQRHRAGDVVEISKAEGERHARRGVVKAVRRASATSEAAADPVPVAEPAGTQDGAAEEVAEPEGAEAGPERPRMTATRDTWAEYALARGLPIEQVAEMDRDALIAALS
ncbi:MULTISPECIES: hypothetical protein [Tomitella]|uniref:Uncharacterized protein n=1 Tax=Tomitella cavernea TaxID=1387982 RepID=A0ABP9CFV6_9ACTN|nr:MULTISPECIES: hypothetical protein [Tomitella]